MGGTVLTNGKVIVPEKTDDDLKLVGRPLMVLLGCKPDDDNGKFL